MQDAKYFIPRAELPERVSLSLPTIWREQRAGRFPAYCRLSPGRVALRADHLDEWLNGRRDWAEHA